MQSSPRIDELRQKFHENPRRYFAPLANEYRKAGDPEQAIAICRAHLAQQPGHMSGHVVYGQALYDADRLDEARVVFQQALALDPENLVVLRHLGDIARRQGDAAEARNWYSRALDGDPQDAEVAAYLEKVALFTPERIAALEAGQVVVKTAADDKGEVSIIGAVRIRTTKEEVQRYFDDYIKFEDGVVVLRVGRFSKPPVLRDVARLQLEKGDIDALRKCRPGDCDVKIGAGIPQLQAVVNWRAPDYAEQLNAFVRQRLVDYVTAYRERGDAALVTYNDKSKTVSLASQWHGLLARSPYLYDYAPALRRYLQEYPRATLEGGHDFIQWSKVDQGMKPVITVTHVVLYQDSAKLDRFSVALKQLYASHYFEGALSFATVVAAGASEGQPASYVVFVNRTLTDVLRGAFGGMKRKMTGGELVKGTELSLQQIQVELEKAAGVR